MREQRAGGRLRIAAWVMIPLGLASVLGGILYFFTAHRGVSVMGDSMDPTHPRGTMVLVTDVDADDIRRGDVLLLRIPGRYGGAPVIQRVIGKGGDRVASDGTQVTVNGKALDEPYLKQDRLPPTPYPFEAQVPEGRLFLMGDNRGNANDSRFFLDEQDGTVPTAAALGRVSEGFPSAVLTAGALGAALILGGIGTGYAAWRRARSAQPAGQAARP
ncbi:signal peptidase I [Streptomyces sp. NPDC093105]|uniref:signal peptidase I n=1 Tax=Streptomyces sp. NPDC093105 TaxID=3366029 RepID=UPI0037F4E71C